MTYKELGFRPLILAAAVGALAACESDESVGGGGGGAQASPAARVCASVADYAPACGVSGCDEALLTDCTAVTSMLADGYLDALASCVEKGDAPLDCLVSAALALEPTDVQRAFAAQFCAECLLGAPGCDDAFFSGEGDAGSIGKLLSVLGDDLVEELQTECATGATCFATFTSCAEQVLARRALPAETIACVLSSWVNGQGAPTCGGGGGGGNGGGGNGPNTSAGPTSTGSQGSGGSDPTTTSGSGGAPGCDTTLPELTDTDDCENRAQTLHGWIDQLNVVALHIVTDDICSLTPMVTVTTPGVEVCQYFLCSAASAESTDVQCPGGTVNVISENGHHGCCGTGQFAADYECGGTLDDSAFVIYEIQPLGSCTEYSIDVSY